MENKESPSKINYVYQVELLIEDVDHKHALEKLIHELNRCEFQDYRVISGLQLGQEIKDRKEKHPVYTPVPLPNEMVQASNSFAGWHTLRSLQSGNKLVRLIVNKGLGVKLSFPCRIINLDEQENLVTIYHVDEKQVYTFLLTEIEEIVQ